MSTSIHSAPQQPPTGGPRPVFWIGSAGLIITGLLGLTSGVTGVLVFVGLYLLVTAIFHGIVGHSWISSIYPASRGRALIGVPAGLALLIAGGATAPHHQNQSATTVVATSATTTPAATSAAPTTSTSTPAPSSTPAMSSSSTTPAAMTHSPTGTHSANPAPASSISSAAHPTARKTTSLPVATSTHTSPVVHRTTQPTPAKPTTTQPNADVVHPGAFCSPEGDTGISAKGKPMVCIEAADGRLRWKKA